MKTYSELTPEQQKKAVDYFIKLDLDGICEGWLRFNDSLNEDDLQSRIDAAIEKAEKMQTPWFAAEYIMDSCGEEITSMARCSAEDCLYPEQHERMVEGIA